MSETKKLQGKVAVITGGTTGIGLAAAKLFVKEGAYVFITGRRKKELDEAVKEIGSNVTGVQGDVARLADLDRLYEEIKAKGKLDIVFANAGVAEFAPLGEITEAHFDKLFNINVKGTLFTVQKALPLLNDGGSIILNGSVASVKVPPPSVSTARRRPPFVHSCGPGPWISRTAKFAPTLLAQARPIRQLSMGNLQRPLHGLCPPSRWDALGEPNEIAKAALFLASDDSSFVTGIELFVDGGRGQI
jgi:NAD(P)-dependent dehydrogenase (short-subunit alcohol dehydrogenase family)